MDINVHYFLLPAYIKRKYLHFNIHKSYIIYTLILSERSLWL
nr:MAG TPA: hypothetical protein [Caudoviricetes sp.]